MPTREERRSPPAARANIPRLPLAPGVYRFRDGRGDVLYVGRATNLRRRVASYWGDLRDRGHLSRMVARIARLEAIECASEHEAAWLERNLLERRLSPWNRTAGGAEVPVFIGLDGGPRSPGLTVVHERRPAIGTRVFGPYLGGQKARLAVSAVERVYPLGYTGAAMRGSGLDLARLRGVDAGSRQALVRAATAVFDRDGAAVAGLLAELGRRRDDAAAALSFELAARLQAEIEAVGWISGVQRATTAEPEDADIHGWAQGVLLHCEVRAGRLCVWRQGPCSERAARRKVAATPAAWTAFAQRNAELASRLTGSS